MKRSNKQNRRQELVGAWVPKDLVERIDAVVEIEDTDRSKWFRKAIREKLASVGIEVNRPSRAATAVAVAAILALLAVSAHAPDCDDEGQVMLPVASCGE